MIERYTSVIMLLHDSLSVIKSLGGYTSVVLLLDLQLPNVIESLDGLSKLFRHADLITKTRRYSCLLHAIIMHSQIDVCMCVNV